MSNSPEKRITHRIPLETFSQISIAGTTTEANAVDLSIQGLRIRTEMYVRNHTKLNLTLFNGAIQCKAQVCWVSPQEDHFEVGLELDYTHDVVLMDLVSQLPKAPEELRILFATPTQLLADSVSLYLSLADVQITAVTSVSETLEALSQEESWDLMVLDDAIGDVPTLQKAVAQKPELASLPIMALAQHLTKTLLHFRFSQIFFEVFTKPIDVQDLMLRAVTLILQSTRYIQVERHLRKAEQQLASVQKSADFQVQEMMTMLNQVMQQSETLGQLIQMQESIMAEETIEGVIQASQKWALENLNATVEIWYYEEDILEVLGKHPLEHSEWTLEQRRENIQNFLQQTLNIIHEEVVLIRKNEYILELLTAFPGTDIIDGLTFFMKVIAIVLQNKFQELALQERQAPPQ